ncbi:GNAT family N-acetyltransferase [Kitasatospora sp. NBC_01287]|uniref:GNAT family N-acetyltransferase n=1 Tax=Kitasatospora sp. NBC_01287 TaxID=2903573 RepID=UPI00225B32B3|nr:GNAT family protein [Kitasatospora sp. NBC_01287]MCX4747454.1 GNAT family N-acetyltransferase [Kitasatospora sp. NBC_01287]
MHPVLLTGPRLTIREFHHVPRDIDALHAIFGDPETARFLPFEPRDREDCADQVALYLEEAENHPRTVYRLAVTLTEEGEDAVPLGNAVLGVEGVESQRAAFIGYALRRDAWGRGYATEIARLLCDFGFGTLDLHRLAARLDPQNLASARVLRKLGFQLEGRLRHDLHLRGAWHDALQYSLLADEWPTGG